ncbi:MAG TPA: hypothetical protein VNN77_08150 [candidate division Zixibacteria bacterium]|nr:hypothetical protein [candidate division Zixibacteria bacterium]
MSVHVADRDGRPPFRGNVTIRITAPEPGRFFSTDYPRVEGTELAEFRLPLDHRGKAEWRYLFPIRGEYAVVVAAESNDGKRGAELFRLRIPENREKWVLAGVFSAGLFLLGIAAGRLFTATGAESTGALAVAVLAASACLLGSISSRASAQEGGKPAGRLEVGPAEVGRPASIQWRALPEAGEPREAELSLGITHEEKRKTVFSIEKVRVPGSFSMKLQFPDGAIYRVTAQALFPDGSSFRSERTVAVSAADPPAGARLRAVLFFLGWTAAGLAAGRWSRKAWPRPSDRGQ